MRYKLGLVLIVVGLVVFVVGLSMNSRSAASITLLIASAVVGLAGLALAGARPREKR